MKQKRADIEIYPARLPLTRAEKLELKDFIRSTGKSAGPWIAIVVLRAMGAEKHLPVEAMELREAMEKKP